MDAALTKLMDTAITSKKNNLKDFISEHLQKISSLQEGLPEWEAEVC
jgi:hypothetical protein